VRYVKGILLGKGQFGTVYKAANVDSGKLMAVKLIHPPTTAGPQEEWIKLRREVEILSRVSHVSNAPSQQL
jgi:serine/threonine protein kinase